jgi:hypothetical protein
MIIFSNEFTYYRVIWTGGLYINDFISFTLLSLFTKSDEKRDITLLSFCQQNEEVKKVIGVLMSIASNAKKPQVALQPLIW